MKFLNILKTLTIKKFKIMEKTSVCEYYERKQIEYNHPVFGKQIEIQHLCNKGKYINNYNQIEQKNWCIDYNDFSKCLIKDNKKFIE